MRKVYCCVLFMKYLEIEGRLSFSFGSNIPPAITFHRVFIVCCGFYLQVREMIFREICTHAFSPEISWDGARGRCYCCDSGSHNRCSTLVLILKIVIYVNYANK